MFPDRPFANSLGDVDDDMGSRTPHALNVRGGDPRWCGERERSVNVRTLDVRGKLHEFRLCSAVNVSYTLQVVIFRSMIVVKCPASRLTPTAHRIARLGNHSSHKESYGRDKSQNARHPVSMPTKHRDCIVL